MACDKKVIYQYYAGLCGLFMSSKLMEFFLISLYFKLISINIISISYGGFLGWPSASFLELQSDDSPLDTGPMTNTQAGYVVSISCLGGLLGTFFFSWCADRIGRKRCLLLTAIPSLLTWGTKVLARNPVHLCIARFLGGFSGAGALAVVPLYIVEFSETRVRGKLGSFIILSCNFGTLIAFVLGYFFSYSTVALVLSLIPVLFLVLFSFLPESPQYLMRQNKIKEAEKALRYFRNVREMISQSSEELKGELERMQVVEKQPNVKDNKITWSDINNRIARKALMIGVGILLLNQLSGCFAMMNYSATILKQAGSNLSPKMGAIVVAIIQIFGSYSSTMLVERAGRKILLVSSAIGTGIGHICLGSYSYLSALGYDTESFNWVPVISFSLIIYIGSLGMLTLPFLIISEVMPPKIRSVGSMFCMTIFWILAFFILMYFPVLTEVLGMHGMLFIFAANCFAGATFLIIFLPETKGKSIEKILSML